MDGVGVLGCMEYDANIIPGTCFFAPSTANSLYSGKPGVICRPGIGARVSVEPVFCVPSGVLSLNLTPYISPLRWPMRGVSNIVLGPLAYQHQLELGLR